VFKPTGQVSHARLANEVFGHQERVSRLNSIVHPAILREIRAQVERLRKDRGLPLIVLDAALLMETGLDRELCQALVFVEAPLSLRRGRAAARSLSKEQFDKRQQAQLPEAAKKERADFVLNNSGSLKDLEQQVERVWPALCSPAGRGLNRRQPVGRDHETRRRAKGG